MFLVHCEREKSVCGQTISNTNINNVSCASLAYDIANIIYVWTELAFV